MNRAVIRWIPPDRGGRTAPPTGPKYLGMVRFEDARDRWPHEAWDLCIWFKQSLSNGDGEVVLADVQFLAPEAPHELLATGARFELYEGLRIVAKGVVLPAEVPVPQQIDEFALSLLG